MIKELEFEMRDGLIIRGQIEGNLDSDNLVVMLHSGGYDRHEKGVKEVTKDENGQRQIIYYNNEGNYDYLTNLLKHNYAIFRIDQRNHGISGKNIDVEKLTKSLITLNVPAQDIQIIINAEHQRDKQTLNKLINKYPNINDIVNRPPLKDMSFLEMKDDLKEVMESLPQKIGKEFTSVDYVGTCMGTVVIGLYLSETKDSKANSLTLFSPLYTFDYSFKNPPAEATFLTEKRKTVEKGKQFRLGNAVEGPKTHKEIETISQTFIQNIADLNIPIFCIQGYNDVLVPQKVQTQIFKNLIDYRKNNNLKETYYALIEGVHCLYDSIFPSVLEASTFIEENKPITKQYTN